MAIPKTMKAAVGEKAGAKVQLKEVPVPEPAAGEVLVKVHACGVCFSDHATLEGHMGPMAKFPLIPGHETVGTVVKVGSGVEQWKEGDLVGGAWHGGHDGTCKSCKKGLFQTCQNAQVNGVSRDGGYAEYATLRAEAAVRLPTDVDKAELAPLLCAGVTVFNSIRKMNIEAGGTVAIQGLGGLGHLAIQYSRKMGYNTVALSSSDSKRDFAHQLGANAYIDGGSEDTVSALKKLGGADLIVATAPNPKVIEPLTGALAPGGKLLILAPVGPVPVNSVDLVLKGASVHGWPSGHAIDSEEAIAFAGRQDVKCMVERFPLDKVQDAIDHMTSGKVRFRGVLIMD